MKKGTLVGIISTSVVFVALLLVATFYDLQISVALGNADSLFGQFFRLFGEATGWIIVPFAGAVLFCSTDKKTIIGRLLTVVWGIVVVVGWFLTVSYFVEEFTGDSYRDGLYGSPYNSLILYDVVFALIISFFHIFIVSKLKKETISKLVIFSIAMIIALALSQIVTTVLKNVWTRQRFRNLDIGNGGTSSNGFTPWYIPGLGKNREAALYYVEDVAGMMKEDAYKSFPSGHTSAAAMSFIVVMLPDIFEKLKKYKVWFYVGPIVYTALVAVSRIVNRAHFLSDVLFGGMIGILSVTFAIIAAKKLQSLCERKKAFIKIKELLHANTDNFVSDNNNNCIEEREEN